MQVAEARANEFIQLPANGWRARPHQKRLWNYFKAQKGNSFDGTNKRAIEVAHRRWGKDEVALHLAAKAAVARSATYWHMLPEYEQGRKAIWNAINPHTGLRRIDEAFPRELRATTDEQRMFIRFKWGATWQVVGSDNYMSLVGTPPAGIVLSEWAKAHPGCWAYLAPILLENGGWALFITTPEGRNHAFNMLELARKNPKGWFAETQTIQDSIKACEAASMKPPVTLENVETQRAEYHALYGQDAGDALIEQEYYCSFSAAVLGAFWGKQISRAEQEGRICTVDVIPDYPVHTAWDIGMDDPMAIWCFQYGPGWFHVVDYIEGSNNGFDFYCNWLNERGYHGIDWVPHDAKQREPGAPGGRTRIATLIALGRKPKLCPDHKPMDRINAGRRILPRVYFDKERCARGLECLRGYKAEWDTVARTFRKTPAHNWASHGADAWGHLAVSVEMPEVKEPTGEAKKELEFGKITVSSLLKLHKRSRGDRRWE